MPYNTAAIPPPEKPTGESRVPQTRIKKIIQQDEDIQLCSKGAVFALAIASEMFVRYLTQQAQNVVKSERRPRRNLQYRDMAAAVARIDNLEFLSDVIPRTTTFRDYKKKKAMKDAAPPAQVPGQTTLDDSMQRENGLDDTQEDLEETLEEVEASDQGREETSELTDLEEVPNGTHVNGRQHTEEATDSDADMAMEEETSP
ncbi:MAG: hypothetical protein M1823_002093 [Watsoniomyces obsoletus]|nr:MAG: hypothetical protein M1823_002093 [Watsoniomyces obsoletus]